MQNLGHCRAKQTFFRSVGLKMDEKQAVTFALFSTFLNPKRQTLTHSAMESYPFVMNRYSVDKCWIEPVSRLVHFLESLPDPQVCSSTLHRSPAGKTFLESIDSIFFATFGHLARTCPVCPRIRRELSRSLHVGGGGGPVVPLEVVAGYLQYLTSTPNKLVQYTF